jgi:hypothetical protein
MNSLIGLRRWWGRLPVMRDGIQSEDRMRVASAGAHFRGDPDRLHDLLRRRSTAHCSSRVAANAIRTLRHVRDSYGNQLLCPGIEGTFREYAFAESAECIRRPWSQSLPLLGELSGNFGIESLFVRRPG